MPDYEKMYHNLFNAMTNAITLLQEAQKDTEEVYINSNPTVLELLKIVPSLEDNTENEVEKSEIHAK